MSIPLMIFGREVPECISPAHHRTMQQIILSCITTIFACTWVAIHPNVPDPDISGWANLKHRVTIMFYAMIAPEFVTMWALRQRIGAGRHVEAYNKKKELRIPWTLTHGFLLEMGGLRKDSRVVERLGDLTEPFDLPEHEINDRSKGDFLTKLFVVLQTTWFLLQCLARWVAHLPVTELEVISLAFCFLNIITYFLWWNKPQKMGVAILVHLRLPIPDTSEPEEELGTHTEKVENVQSKGTMSLLSLFPRLYQAVGGGMRTVRQLPATAAQWIKVAYFDVLGMDFGDWLCFLSRPLVPLLAMTTAAGRGVVQEIVPPMVFHSSVNCFEDLQTLLPFFIISVVFGCLHLIPIWTSSFPSNVEKCLWIIFSSMISVEPVLIAIVLFPTWSYINYSPLPPLALGAFIIVPCSTVYIVARLVLIVLAFTTLRELPQGVYQNIEWTTFFSHF
ncbi:hypothetical protein P691DRAFT_842859 [Macrolepiota fuliginosa MF-IS2]|uniref:Uncharacterized protein n=1 Tax=Macrolepiota fuliginosa MF-IS2 TaxID=1400762 RepID=A0A9P5X2P3_9AGAR|nr:hypothetical protein P691DRAFT_842859 [Macrolepiota fuliginosa MF-IS2]